MSLSAKVTQNVLIIGGGPAGLSAALMLARLGYKINIFDSGEYRNASSPVAHSLPGWEGKDPAIWRATVRSEVSAYSEHLKILKSKVESIEKVDRGFVVSSRDVETGVVTNVGGAKVILATGLEDILPPIPGFKELWGTRIIHCVFCHGYEHKGQKLAALVDKSSTISTMFTLEGLFTKFMPRIIQDATLLLNGIAFEESKDTGITTKHILLAKAHNAKLVLSEIASIAPQEGPLGLTVTFRDGTTENYDVLLFSPSIRIQPSIASLIADVGLSVGPIRSLPFPVECVENTDGKTAVEGFFVAGNAQSAIQNIMMACDSGAKAAMMVIQETEMGEVPEWENKGAQMMPA